MAAIRQWSDTSMSDQDNVIYFYEPEQEGDFLSGVPRRDLTQADFDRLSPVELRELFGSKIYTKAGKNAEGTALKDLSRADLNKHASSVGIKNPESFKNKAELIAAIESTPKPPQAISVPVVEDTGHGLAVTGIDAVSPNEDQADTEPDD
jgi:hypothetical protein